MSFRNFNKSNKSNKSLGNTKDIKDIKDINNIIKGSNTLLKLFCCLTIFIIICILIGNYAFKNGILTCDHYVFNTYLYIILAILLIFIIVLINDQFGIFNSFIIWLVQGSIARLIITIIAILVILFVLINQLNKVNPENILVSNLIWFSLIFILGFFLIPTIWFGRLNDVVGLAGILTISITAIVGLAGYYYGDQIVTFDWDTYLSYSLFGIIIVSIIGRFLITDYNQMMNFFLVISIISLIIFTLLLLSNHKKLKQNADKCIDGKVVPNYPVESFGLFIKILNIFQDLIRILGSRRR
jgi:FtsH-binding integral membrane protein